ncbi:outer membrane beta-barrel protein [Hahella sp. CR1]|uniref:outer membrane beta-barrel protein n=1 Tax=unclassified Hahella TaxID=2624107 RepID=UPI0024430E53|nr:outer membrane beta-barrel protein [Hahella sp. CR1]MDG9668966.1 porin family protein [Hahella sp. CR1]
MRQITCIFTCLACFSAPVLAETWYVGADGGVGMVKASSEKFYIPAANVRLGGRLENGVGLEALFSTGVTDSEEANVNMELNSMAGGYLTYTGVLSDTTLLTLGVGYVATELETEVGGKTSDLSFDGTSLAIRLEEPLRAYPSVKLSAGYYHVFEDDGVKIRNFGLGLQYDF